MEGFLRFLLREGIISLHGITGLICIWRDGLFNISVDHSIKAGDVNGGLLDDGFVDDVIRAKREGFFKVFFIRF